MTLKTLRNFFFAGIILILNACSQAGWVGYYHMDKPAIYKNVEKKDFNIFFYPNSVEIKISNTKKIGLSLEKECSGFKFAGIGTPFTPPIPLPSFRSWSSAGKNDDGFCYYFTAYTKSGIKSQLILDNKKVYEPEIVALQNGYIKHKFPVKIKNLDSGVIILEKDGQKVEVPFEYKYFKFWY